MTKFFASRTARAALTTALTIATVALWGAAAHAETTGKLNADGTCGGLPAKCCDYRTGSAALCKAPALLPSSKISAALHYAPLGAAKGNPPSAARAQMAKYNVPGGCVVTFEIRKDDGAVIRHSHCEYSAAQIQRLATTGR